MDFFIIKWINAHITKTANIVFNISIIKRPIGNLLNITIFFICWRSGLPSLFKSKENNGSKNDWPNDDTNLSTLPAISHVNAVAITDKWFEVDTESDLKKYNSKYKTSPIK